MVDSCIWQAFQQAGLSQMPDHGERREDLGVEAVETSQPVFVISGDLILCILMAFRFPGDLD